MKPAPVFEIGKFMQYMIKTQSWPHADLVWVNFRPAWVKFRPEWAHFEVLVQTYLHLKSDLRKHISLHRSRWYTKFSLSIESKFAASTFRQRLDQVHCSKNRLITYWLTVKRWWLLFVIEIIEQPMLSDFSYTIFMSWCREIHTSCRWTLSFLDITTWILLTTKPSFKERHSAIILLILIPIYLLYSRRWSDHKNVHRIILSEIRLQTLNLVTSALGDTFKCIIIE